MGSEEKGDYQGKGVGRNRLIWNAQSRQAEVEKNIINGEAKEYISTSQGHEVRVGCMGGNGSTEQREAGKGKLRKL